MEIAFVNHVAIGLFTTNHGVGFALNAFIILFPHDLYADCIRNFHFYFVYIQIKLISELLSS